MGTPYATAYRGLFQRGLAKPNETVLVHGASGGVGTAAVQLGSARGVRMFGTAGTEAGRSLVREQGGSRGKGKREAQAAVPDAQVIRVRQTALGRVLILARSDPHCATAARPVFVQALGDPNQAVRLQAFEHLDLFAAVSTRGRGLDVRGVRARNRRVSRHGWRASRNDCLV